jgi:hypothetical protein
MWLDIKNPVIAKNEKESDKSPVNEESNNCKDTLPKDLRELFFADKQMPDLVLDYDVIGFDADHSLVKYNVAEFAKLIARSFFEDMHNIYGYPEEILDFDYE